MTQSELNEVVKTINNTLATNNPKGVTEALRRINYRSDARFDILSNADLNQALWNIYVSNKNTWGEVVKSVPFNYQKTDDSTSPATRAKFESIGTSINPSAKFNFSNFFDTVVDLALGSTTTTTTGAPAPVAKTPTWVYIGLTLLGLAIVGLVIFAILQIRKK